MVHGDKLNFGNGVEGLGDIAASTDAHQAVGRWWAHALLAGVFNNGSSHEGFVEAGARSRAVLTTALNDIMPVIGTFADEVEAQSRVFKLNTVECDYYPDVTLDAAAENAGLPETGVSIFPWKSRTVINHDGSVSAKLGCDDRLTKVWPPELADPNLS